VEYFDDSKGTNVGATVAALTGLGADRRLVVILGGEGKGQDFSPLAAPVARSARAVVLIGRDAPLIRAHCRDTGVAAGRCADAAARRAAGPRSAPAGDAVLMSPACASFDMFQRLRTPRAGVLRRRARAGARCADRTLEGECMSRRHTPPESGMAAPYGWLGGCRQGRRCAAGARGRHRVPPVHPQHARRVLGFDQALLWVVVALLAWGLVMVYSASIAMPDNPRFGNYAPHISSHAHMMCAGDRGLCGGAAGVSGAHGTWERVAPWLFVVSLVLLVAVLIPHVGKVVNGARRWLSLGPMAFSPRSWPSSPC
jgi:hypothetical protein